MRSKLLVPSLCAGLAACGGGAPPSPATPTAPAVDVRRETDRMVAAIDDQVRFANNGMYNRFRWMDDGTFCYTTQSKAEILKWCFLPNAIDPSSIAVRSGYSLGAPYDRVGFACRGAPCIKRSSQLTSMFGPRGHHSESALAMATRRGGGQAAARSLRYLLSLWRGRPPPAR